MFAILFITFVAFIIFLYKERPDLWEGEQYRSPFSSGFSLDPFHQIDGANLGIWDYPSHIHESDDNDWD